jgi:ethanolamine utilization protein EutQ (cupin superfamily)
MVKPETVFKVGAVRASVFQNTIEKNGQSIQLPKVVIEVRYKDKSGQWQGTNSLSINDLPKAILALQKAFEYLMERKDPGQPGNTTVSDLYD